MKETHVTSKFLFAIRAGLLLVALALLAKNSSPVYAAGSGKQVLFGLTTAGEDSVNVGIAGTYMAQQQEALDRINEIRYEACQNGYPDPREPSRNLTLSDYVPIQWSSALEAYARIRAAEAVVYPDHGRPGSNVYIDSGLTYTTGNAEVLAWPGGTLKGGVNQWYGEKDTWVNRRSGVTGHYTSMINPNNTYVGLGGFLTDDNQLGSEWGGCVCGRFMRSNGDTSVDSTMAPEQKNVIQVISMNKSYLSDPEVMDISGENSEIYQGNTMTYAVVRQAVFPATAIGVTNATVLDMGSYTYTSSAPEILLMDSEGNATAVKAGNATVIAQSADNTYIKTVEVKSHMKTPQLSKLTAGKKQLKASFKVTSETARYATGFEIQTATDKKFKKNVKKSTVKIKVKNWSVVTSYSKTFKKLKPKKTYYVRVRAYTKENGEKYYTSWSKVKHVKVQ